MNPWEVRLKTADGVEIAGTYNPGSLPFGAVLLHMMPATRSSYNGLAGKLSEMGLHTLAIDLRGHGQSAGGDYRDFTDEQHQKSIFDVMAAVEYLHRKNPDMAIGFVGASIGANLALQYAAANPAAFLVLLSPGLNYHGVETGRTVVSVPENLPVYFVSALDDGRVEGNSSQTETLYNACSSKKKTINIFQEGGHGTEIFENVPDFLETLPVWISGNLSSSSAGI